MSGSHDLSTVKGLNELRTQQTQDTASGEGRKHHTISPSCLRISLDLIIAKQDQPHRLYFMWTAVMASH
jgi:hypothetical protein